uniref:Uncharacterized protein n=1 Tax=Tanacetum cinerariifolium TaxID=118510 RepID=A0A699U384_TANCI|nr:hypothetical protein [Tanacetum cinerariifolium]
MRSTTTNWTDELLPEITKFKALLQEDIQAALEYLNHRTPHRYTGGQAYGTLCHYDMQRCQERTTDLPLLEAAAPLLYQHFHASGGAPTAGTADSPLLSSRPASS